MRAKNGWWTFSSPVGDSQLLVTLLPGHSPLQVLIVAAAGRLDPPPKLINENSPNTDSGS